MSTDRAFARRAHEEDWLPTLELAILEVFEIMMGCKVKASTEAASLPKGGFCRFLLTNRLARPQLIDSAPSQFSFNR
jgi:hypothetical protein